MYNLLFIFIDSLPLRHPNRWCHHHNGAIKLNIKTWWLPKK